MVLHLCLAEPCIFFVCIIQPALLLVRLWGSTMLEFAMITNAGVASRPASQPSPSALVARATKPTCVEDLESYHYMT